MCSDSIFCLHISEYLTVMLNSFIGNTTKKSLIFAIRHTSRTLSHWSKAKVAVDLRFQNWTSYLIFSVFPSHLLTSLWYMPVLISCSWVLNSFFLLVIQTQPSTKTVLLKAQRSHDDIYDGCAEGTTDETWLLPLNYKSSLNIRI